MTDFRANLHMIPTHMQEAMCDYIENGYKPSSFLSAVLSNDLRGSFERADDINQRAIFNYLKFLYSYAPSSCWGSKDNFEAWLDKGGMNGKVSK